MFILFSSKREILLFQDQMKRIQFVPNLKKKTHIFFNINYINYHSNQLLFKFLILYVKDQIIPYFDLKSCFSVFNAHWYWVGIVHVRWFHMVCFLWVNCVLLSTWYEYISSMTFTGRFNDPYLLMRDYTST